MDEPRNAHWTMQFSLRTLLEIVFAVAVLFALFRAWNDRSGAGKYQLSAAGTVDANGNRRVDCVLVDTTTGQCFICNPYVNQNKWQKLPALP